MRTIAIFALALSFSAGAALAQTSSGTSGSGTSGTGSSATGRSSSTGTTGTRAGAPALVPIPSGPVTSNRLSTDIYPPSRLLAPTDGSVQGSTGATVGSGLPAAGSTTTTGTGGAALSGSSDTTSDQSQLNQTGQLGTNVQIDPNSMGPINGNTQGTTQSTTQSTTGQANTMGFNAQGGASNQLQQIEPNTQTSGGSSITGRTGRNQLTVTVNDCIKLWDDKTHMSKTEWASTCKRVQNHLNNVITD